MYLVVRVLFMNDENGHNVSKPDKLTMTVSPVNKVGASVSFPYSSARAGPPTATAVMIAADAKKCPTNALCPFKHVFVRMGLIESRGFSVNPNTWEVGRDAKAIRRRQVNRIIVVFQL